MTQDVKVNVTRIATILGLIVAFVVLAAALRDFGDERYAKRGELEEVRGITLDVLCSKNVDPANRRCR